MALVAMLLLPMAGMAQFNTDRLVTIGRSALYYEDYVLSIQYFNQAITAKPYLYEPWFYRAVAKYYLDDFVGAENDCTKAIERNPYVVSTYELRGITRIRQGKYADAVSDYSRALRYDPENRLLWHNRVLCRIQDKDYDTALCELDTINAKWGRYAPGYSIRGEVHLMRGDTLLAIEAFDKSIEIDPYDGTTWAERAMVDLAQSKWQDAEERLDKAIHLMPRHAGNHINRALARINRNNLRGAMADYDMALDLEPNNFLGHYNRGLLRAQVGDDNRAITDFDFVLALEPDNYMALFNRALLLDKTGDLRGAIRDYSRVIDEFPNFWTGLLQRAECYRRLGMTKEAEADEFRVYKAQLYKSLYGTQPRLDKSKQRKRSDEDMEKYNQLVVADTEEMERKYESEYRGRVQDRKADEQLLPMFGLAFSPHHSDVMTYVAYDRVLDKFNQTSGSKRTLYLNSNQDALDETQTQGLFTLIDSLSNELSTVPPTQKMHSLLLLRAVAYTATQNFDNAVEDLTTILLNDSTSALAYWQRAVCQQKICEFNSSLGTDMAMKQANVMADIERAISNNPRCAYLLYNRGNVFAARKDYSRAIADYTEAIAIDGGLAEAYYNRGLMRLLSGQSTDAMADLSKAGELGLYQAYSLLKKHTPKDNGEGTDK